MAVSRGVSTWLDAAAEPGRACRRRIFIGTIDARLVALDAAPLSETPSPERAAFLAGLRERGWIEGKTIAVEYR